MVHFRYTIEELNTDSDIDMLKHIILERMGDCTNIYAPLYKRLQLLLSKLERGEKLDSEKAKEVGYLGAKIKTR